MPEDTHALDLDETLELHLQGTVPHGFIFAGRYRVRELLGAGTSGRVYRADDELLGKQVALKAFSALEPTALRRIRRELVSLRLLAFPGVVQLLDEGEHTGRPFLVMELVDGTPFPGHDANTWSQIRTPTLGLLETLGRVHANGVLHRDLKPSNVLVDARGQATVLDFGLARGDAVGADLTTEGMVMGTPAYLAPELFRGERASPRTDIYAVAAMLYESLSGRRPHPYSTLSELIARRLQDSPVPLRDLTPEVPRHVAQAVDQALSRDPSARHESADQFLHAVLGDPAQTSGAMWVLPNLPRREVLDRLEAELSSPGLVELRGPAGSGRTQLLRGLAERAQERGQVVLHLLPGERAFSTLGRALKCGDPPPEFGLREAQNWYLTALDRAHASGAVLLGEAPSRWDRLSQKLVGVRVDILRGALEAGLSPKPNRSHSIPPLGSDELRSLFSGPNRVLHEVDDAVDVVLFATGGLPGRVATELARWRRLGLVERTDNHRLRLSRASLARLRAGGTQTIPTTQAQQGRLHFQDRVLGAVALAGRHATVGRVAHCLNLPCWEVEAELHRLETEGLLLTLSGDIYRTAAGASLAAWSAEERAEVEARLAEVLPTDSKERLFHLIAAGAEAADILETATLLVFDHLARGQIEETISLCETALAAVRDTTSPSLGPLLEAYADAIFLSGTDSALAVALYHLDRTSEFAGAAVRDLATLVSLALQAHRGGGQGIANQLEKIQPSSNSRLALWIHGSRDLALRYCDSKARRALLDELSAWSNRESKRERGAVSGWRGHWLYDEGQFAEAAEAHLVAARLHENPVSALTATVAAAFSLVECEDFSRARELAEDARERAAVLRHTLVEGRAEWLLRILCYREEEEVSADLELVEIAEVLGSKNLLIGLSITEAACAWRAGDLEVAGRLAARSAEVAQGARATDVAALARAFGWVLAGGTPPEPDASALLQIGAECAQREFGAQILGLLALAGLEEAGRVLRENPVPTERTPTLRLDILSPAEWAAAAEGTWSGPPAALGD